MEPHRSREKTQLLNRKEEFELITEIIVKMIVMKQKKLDLKEERHRQGEKETQPKPGFRT